MTTDVNELKKSLQSLITKKVVLNVHDETDDDLWCPIKSFQSIDEQNEDEDDDEKWMTIKGHEDDKGPEEEKTENRGEFSGTLEFLFTCIGYAVGLGNIWRFPYLCYRNGGGAFLFPYFIMLAIIGVPIFFLEISFGQFASLGPLTIWKINPLLKGIGYATVATVWMFNIYYNVIVSHILFFLFASIKAIFYGIEWDRCDHSWNTELCLSPSSHNNTNATSALLNLTTPATLINTTVNSTISLKTRTAAQEYYNIYVLEKSTGIDDIGGINWKLCLCLLLAWIIVLICLIKGVQSLGKVVYFTALFPYVMLTILLIRGVTLEGAAQGIIFYLKPEFNKLLQPKVWCDAASQIFYSLGCCTGGLIAMSSYNNFNDNCLKNSLIVALINCLTSFYAGFVIFSVLGFMAYEKGVPVSEVAVGGPGLAFEVYPEAIARMPVPALWAILFFIMMATLGFGSQFSQVECFICAFTDEWAHVIRKSQITAILFRIIVMVKFFLLGLPMVTKAGMYFVNLVDTNAGTYPLLIVGFCEVISINHIYGFEFFAEDIKLMLGSKPGIFWKLAWKFITPLVIIITITFTAIYSEPLSLGDYLYPQWAIVLGWLVGMFPITLIPIFFLTRFCSEGGFKLMKMLMKPAADWGPASDENRQGARYQMNLLRKGSIFNHGKRAVCAISLNITRQTLIKEDIPDENNSTAAQVEMTKMV